MSRSLLLSCAMAGALGLAACNNADSNQEAEGLGDSPPVNAVQDVAAGPVGLASAATLGATTENYVPAAAMADLYEVEAGKIAVERGQSADVKQFGQMMVDHHTKMMNEMKAAYQQAGVPIPPATLDDRRQGMLQNLRAASDATFDAGYLHQQLAAHLEALTLHSTYASRGDNAVLKAAAEKAQPVIQSHIDRLREIGGDAVQEAAS